MSWAMKGVEGNTDGALIWGGDFEMVEENAF